MPQPRPMFLLLLPLLATSVLGWAQDSARSSSEISSTTSPAASSSAPASATAAKKVWTNEDLDALHGGTGVSVIGPPASSSKGSTAATKPAGGRDAKWYRAQLKALNDKIPPIDAEIDEMHHFQDGSYQSPGGIVMGQNRPLNPADRIAQLQKQKQGILDRVEALEDEARHAGIPPGDLR